MQLKINYLILLLLAFTKVDSQNINSKPFYLLYDERESCNNKFKKFHATFYENEDIKFTIRDCKNDTNETFVYDSKVEIDSLPSIILNSLDFITIEQMNEINMNERKQIFNNKKLKSIFSKKPIYIIRKTEAIFLRYKVEWTNRVLMRIQEDD